MLAVVNQPRIEMIIHGEDAAEVIAYLQKRWPVTVLQAVETPVPGPADASTAVPFRQTTFWRGLEKNLAGHLLAGTRAKLRLSQTKAAALAKIPQSLLSAYETGRKRLTPRAAAKLGHAWGDDSLAGVLLAAMSR